MELSTKSFRFEVKSVSDDGSTFEGYGAVFHNIDGGRDIIHPNAYDDHLAFFQMEGKVRDEHMVTTGKVVEAKVDAANGLFIKGMVSDTTAGRDQKVLLKDGVYKSLSIGQYVLGRTYLETPEEIADHWKSVGYQPTEQDMIASGSPVRLITKAKPLEVSTTFNPMNTRARITDVKTVNGQPTGLTLDAHSESTLGMLEEYKERLVRLAGKRLDEGRPLAYKHRATLLRLADQIESLLSATDPDSIKGAVSFAAAPVDDGEWDAVEAEKRLKAWANGDMAKYRRGFAWFDASKADDFGSYKLPHHDVRDGKLVTVKKGVEAAAGAVDGARGGVGIPESDHPKVKAHLAKHYHQWGGKAPWEDGEGEKEGKEKPGKSSDASASSGNEKSGRGAELFLEFQSTLAAINGVRL